jgi:branched-chain amino acid aminotransferase
MSIRSEFIWMDGKLVPFDDAKVHVLSHALHYGMGAFEGIRAYQQPDGNAGIFRLDEHIERLVDTARILMIPLPFTHDEIRQACLDVVAANGFSEAYVRPIAFTGMGKMGLGARDNPVHVVVAAWHWGAYLGAEGMSLGARLRTSSYARNHPNASMARAKVVGHYVNSIIARYEANDDGFDEALMLDFNGYVAEGTGENVFIIRGGVAKTPPAANILPGLTRKTCTEILRKLNVHVEEAFFGRDAVYVADEGFLCGTAAEITPIRSLDRRDIGDGRPGPLTREVQRLYLDGVRGRVDWLAHLITPVPPR